MSDLIPLHFRNGRLILRQERKQLPEEDHRLRGVVHFQSGEVPLYPLFHFRFSPLHILLLFHGSAHDPDEDGEDQERAEDLKSDVVSGGDPAQAVWVVAVAVVVLVDRFGRKGSPKSVEPTRAAKHADVHGPTPRILRH